MKQVFELIRIKHWIKNLLIFIPLLCAKANSMENIVNCIIGFFAFSFLSSFIYILNDIKDIKSDKMHPRKKNRPLASEKISKNTAFYFGIVLLITSFVLNYFINNKILDSSLCLLLLYLIINIIYSFGAKNIVIIDVLFLATGFLIRVYYGAYIIGVEVSSWLFLTITNASLFLGLGKRKKELTNNVNSRETLQKYSYEFLDKFQYLCLSLTIIFYSFWAMENNNYLIYTVPLLIIIFMRYCLLIEKNEEGDPITILYTDLFLILMSLLYGIIFILCMF